MILQVSNIACCGQSLANISYLVYNFSFRFQFIVPTAKHNLLFPVIAYVIFFFRKQREEKGKQDAKFKKMNGLLDSNMKKRMHLMENYDRLVCYQLYHMPAFCLISDTSAILRLKFCANSREL